LPRPEGALGRRGRDRAPGAARYCLIAFSAPAQDSSWTFRRYRLTDRGEIARVQYGVNFRQSDGRTYSAPDVPGDGPTRNLGIVMEGEGFQNLAIASGLQFC
jgi:hypothetical protein